MSVSLAQSQSASARADDATAACGSKTAQRFPLVFLFVCSAIWLFVSSTLALVASLKFHSPAFLGNSAWLTYGRIYPAHWSALIYGFAIPAGLAICLWLLSRIGQTRIMLPGLAAVGALIWNFGVLLGVAG